MIFNEITKLYGIMFEKLNDILNCRKGMID